MNSSLFSASMSSSSLSHQPHRNTTTTRHNQASHQQHLPHSHYYPTHTHQLVVQPRDPNTSSSSLSASWPRYLFTLVIILSVGLIAMVYGDDSPQPHHRQQYEQSLPPPASARQDELPTTTIHAVINTPNPNILASDDAIAAAIAASDLPAPSLPPASPASPSSLPSSLLSSQQDVWIEDPLPRDTPSVIIPDVPNDELPESQHIRWTKLEPRAIGGIIPSWRYGHNAVTTNGSMYITMGYFYNGKTNTPTWLSDTWRYSVSHNWWIQVQTGTALPTQPQPQKLTVPSSLSTYYTTAKQSLPATAAATTSLGPTARYASISVVYKGDIYLHGGDDGGSSSPVRSSSTTHSIFSDLWHFCTHSHKWSRVAVRTTHPAPSKLASLFSSQPAPSVADLAHPPPPPGSPAPPLGRAQHAGTVLGDLLYVFGGLGYRPISTERRYRPLDEDDGDDTATDNTINSASVYDTNDMWIFDFTKLVWIEMQFDSATIPPPRFGHSMVSPSTSTVPLAAGVKPRSKELYIFGGFSRGVPNRDDLWRLRIDDREWTELYHSEQPSPIARAYHSMVALSNALVLFGGAKCEPGCVCSNELWLYHFDGHDGDTAVTTTTTTTSDTGAAVTRTYTDGRRHGWQQIKTTVTPMRRYKQTMISITQNTLAPAPPGLKGFTPSLPSRVDLYLFGGESYNPAHYHNDIWRMSVAISEDGSLSFGGSPTSVQYNDAAAMAAQVTPGWRTSTHVHLVDASTAGRMNGLWLAFSAVGVVVILYAVMRGYGIGGTTSSHSNSNGLLGGRLPSSSASSSIKRLFMRKQF